MFKLIKGNQTTFEEQIKKYGRDTIIKFACSDDAHKFVALLWVEGELERETIIKEVEKEVIKEVDNPALIAENKKLKTDIASALNRAEATELALKECSKKREALSAENEKLKAKINKLIEE